MKHAFFLSIVFLNLFIISLNSHATVKPKTKISVEEMQDKIKGGWAGQVIGCTFGGTTEARYNIFKLELSIDGKVNEQFEMSTSFIIRKYDIAWNYQLAQGKHQVKVRVLNPKEGYSLYVSHLIVYSSEKVANAMNTK